jgi:hypothetical protein
MLTERLHKLENDAHTTPKQPSQGPNPHTAPKQPAKSAVPPGAGAKGGTPPAGTSTGSGSGGGMGSAVPAAAGGAAAGAGAGGGGSFVPPSPPPPGHPHSAAANHATLDAKHVSNAAQHGESLPARVWNDIERNASDPQYAIAYLSAIGAAGLAVLGAAIAKNRKKNKDKREADRQQAALDKMLNSAGAAPAATVPVTPEDVVMPPDGHQAPPPGTDGTRVPAGQMPAADAGPPPDGEPGKARLHLVTAGSAQPDDGASGEPALDKIMGEQ